MSSIECFEGVLSTLVHGNPRAPSNHHIALDSLVHPERVLRALNALPTFAASVLPPLRALIAAYAADVEHVLSSDLMGVQAVNVHTGAVVRCEWRVDMPLRDTDARRTARSTKFLHSLWIAPHDHSVLLGRTGVYRVTRDAAAWTKAPYATDSFGWPLTAMRVAGDADEAGGFADGPALTVARFAKSIVFHSSPRDGREVLVLDSFNERIRCIDTVAGVVTTIAGTDTGIVVPHDDGPALERSLVWPTAAVVDPLHPTNSSDAPDVYIATIMCGMLHRLNRRAATLTTVRLSERDLVLRRLVGTPSGWLLATGQIRAVDSRTGEFVSSNRYSVYALDPQTGVCHRLTGNAHGADPGPDSTAGIDMAKPIGVAVVAQSCSLLITDEESSRVRALTLDPALFVAPSTRALTVHPVDRGVA